MYASGINDEKPSTHTQWRETRTFSYTEQMNDNDIREFAAYLAKSYNCPPSDISFSFERITDPADTDRKTCLWLIFKMKCASASSGSVMRNIFKIKIRMPDDLIQRAEMELRTRTANMPKLLSAPVPRGTAAPSWAPPNLPAGTAGMPQLGMPPMQTINRAPPRIISAPKKAPVRARIANK